MQSSANLNTDDGVRVVFPTDFFVIPNNRCKVSGQSTNYICMSYSTTNAVEVTYLPRSAMVQNQ